MFKLLLLFLGLWVRLFFVRQFTWRNCICGMSDMLLSSFCHYFQTLPDPFTQWLSGASRESRGTKRIVSTFGMPCQWSQPQANPVRVGTTKSYGINVIRHCLVQQLYWSTMPIHNTVNTEAVLQIFYFLACFGLLDKLPLVPSMWIHYTYHNYLSIVTMVSASTKLQYGYVLCLYHSNDSWSLAGRRVRRARPDMRPLSLVNAAVSFLRRGW